MNAMIKGRTDGREIPTVTDGSRITIEYSMIEGAMCVEGLAIARQFGKLRRENGQID